MTIIEDVNNKLGKHTVKNDYWKENGTLVIRNGLPFGDYCIMPSIVVDTKQNIQEIYMDLISDHVRFKNSCILAKECGSKFVILIENTDGITCIEEVQNWDNPRLKEWYKIKAAHDKGKMLYKKIPNKAPATSLVLMKTMQTMQERYDVIFDFCTPEESAQKVLDILQGN